MASMGQWIGRVLAAIALVVLLSGCGAVGPGPGYQLVEKAVALELGQTQQEIHRQLSRDNGRSVSVQINHLSIKIKTEMPLEIEGLQGFLISGTCDYTLKLGDRQIRERQIPFQTYLQRQSEGKTWRFARQTLSEDGKPIWVTQKLPF